MPTSTPSRLPPVPLNHLYVVVDSATYAAMRADTFMRHAFAPSEERTTVRTDQTYTGLYFYGIHTYFELFDVGTSVGGRVGDYGLAFGVEQVGGIAALLSALGPRRLRAPELVTRGVEGRQVSWFWMAKADALPSCAAHSVWLMEYLPTFLAEWHARSGPPPAAIARDAVLARYCEVLPDPVAGPILADVERVTIGATRETREALAALCGSFGYRPADRADGGVELHGPEIVLALAPVAAERDEGVRAIHFRIRGTLTAPVERRLGAARLTFADGGATLVIAT